MVRRIIRIDREKCSGCGACASACHEGAIEMIDGIATLTREAHCDGLGDCLPTCPTGAITFEVREAAAYSEDAVHAAEAARQSRPTAPRRAAAPSAQLAQWPCQIKLVPVRAPYFDSADLLIAADCTAFAYGNFHADFMKDHITLIGCPKLDEGDYAEKLTQIISLNDIKSIRILRMEVPCCGGLENAVKRAMIASDKRLPWQVVTISTDGKISE